jgi:membrane-associated phospholipid phosphatase
MKKIQGQPGLFTSRDLLITSLLSAAYLLVSALLVGFKSDQLFLVVLFNLLYYASGYTRKFIVGFSVFIVYWIVFDYMKAFPNYLFADVHTGSLHAAEKAVFGIQSGGSIITPNEYFLEHHSTFFDILSGIFYLCWIPVPLAFGTYLFFTNRRLFLQFSLTFFLVNLVGFVGYYTYPAAPPWYLQEHGLIADLKTAGSTAGLHRFDDYFGVNIFQSIYAKSSNVFAAMPSLHSAYPLIVVYYGFKKKLGYFNIIFMIVTIGIWFAAIYTSHHYILDVLAGILCAVIGIFLFEKILKTRSFNRFLEAYLKKIS